MSTKTKAYVHAAVERLCPIRQDVKFAMKHIYLTVRHFGTKTLTKAYVVTVVPNHVFVISPCAKNALLFMLLVADKLIKNIVMLVLLLMVANVHVAVWPIPNTFNLTILRTTERFIGKLYAKAVVGQIYPLGLYKIIFLQLYSFFVVIVIKQKLTTEDVRPKTMKQ